MERKKLVKVCGVVISFLGIIGITYREDLKKGYQKIKEPDNQKEVVWITESSIKDIQDEMEAGLNKLLEKKGCCYKVKFVSFPMETYEDDVKKYLSENSADILYSNLRVVGDDRNDFYTFYKNNYLRKLTSDEIGRKLYGEYSEATWKTMQINGDIYGIPAYSNEGNGLYYVLNNNILDKYHLDISDITEDLKSLSPMLEYVAEQEKENTSFVPILPYEYMIYAPGYTELLDVIRIKEQEEIPRAENILENEQIRNSVLILNEFYKNGYLREASESTIVNGNFFINIMYADAPELLQEYFDSLCKDAGKPVLKLKFVKIGEHYTTYRTGGMNSVIANGNEDAALEILRWVTTDKEISDYLKYGNEELGNVPVMMQWMFGNDRWYRKSDQTVSSVIAGFQFDGSGYKEKIDELSLIFYKHENLFRGMSESPEEEYESMIEEMRDEGINQVAEAVNIQLDEWKTK